MERVILSIQPDVFKRYRNTSYRFVSFDVPRLDLTKPDGTKGVWWGEDDVWCTLLDDMTGERVRVHLQDRDLE